MKARLALDCSTSRGSVALVTSEGSPLWTQEFAAGRGRGGALFAALDEALRIVPAHSSGLAEILIGLGPGSYSGVRQAIAAAVGLSLATGARLAGLPSPLALDESASACVVIGDARRGTFYFTVVNAGGCTLGPLLLENRMELETHLAAHADLPIRIMESPLPDGIFPDTEVRFPAAARLLTVPREIHIAPPLEPIYLRPVSITLPNPPNAG